MSVLITGGAGFIGSHTNRHLASQGIDTIVLDDLSNGHHEAVVEGKLVEGDFGDLKLLDSLMTKDNIDSVIHFAAFASVPDSVVNPAKYYINNVTKLQTLLDCCVSHGVKELVFSSSAAIFGQPVSVPMDENHPKFPINPYGTTKLIGEGLLADYERAYGIHYCALRYFCASGSSKDGLIGESHNPETHLIPVMMNSAIHEKPFHIFGIDYPTRDGSCIRDFIHVLDLAEAHLLALMHIKEGNSSDCFNLGSGKGVTVLEMVNKLEKVIGKPVPYAIAGRREGDPDTLVASNEKAQKILGWNPRHSSIEEILTDSWNWEKNRRY